MDIILLGSGRMGSLVLDNLAKDHNFVAVVDREHPLKTEGLIAAEVAIDFSSPELLMDAAPRLFAEGISLVSGTTGLTDSQLSEIDRLAVQAKVGAFVVPSFDLSLLKFRESLRVLDGIFTEAQITDYHHRSKKDMPSGAALFLAEAFNKTRVNFVSYRLDRYVYRHRIRLGDNDRKILLTHEVKNRNVYLEGLNLALSAVKSFVGLRTTLSV